MYQVEKHYGHDRGLSVCFRQWRAKSHCAQLHGYALAFTFTFQGPKLNECNWLVDFGDLGQLLETLKIAFDHKLIVANDDPFLKELHGLDGPVQIANLVTMNNVGCEAFAELAWTIAQTVLASKGLHGTVQCVAVRVAEHGGNSATYLPEVVV